jgi:glycosyltransferase involved in cell wall biosynthesis
VLIAAWNADRYLGSALDSVLAQTVRDIEVVAVDDASTDSTPDVLAAAARRDGRVRVVQLPQNVGLAGALNRGLAECRGAVIVRMDADDLALPDRVDRQLAFLDEHASVGLVGTQAEMIDREGARLGVLERPTAPTAVLWHSLLDNPFIHPTVAMRRQLLEQVGGYREDLRSAQDYELWHRVLSVSQGANLREVLLQYRSKAGGTTEARRGEQLQNHRWISNARVAALLGTPMPSEELELLRRVFVSPEFGAVPRFDRLRAFWLYRKLGTNFRKAMHFSAAERRVLMRTMIRHAAAALASAAYSPRRSGDAPCA